MVLSIVAYGDPVLRKKAAAISESYLNLGELIANMFETMYHAYGVGLAAPQVGLPIRLFVVDTRAFAEGEKVTKAEREQLRIFKKVFINPVLMEETGDTWLYNEGCLSIPDIREDVSRKEIIRITYYDERFVKHTEEYDGLRARVIQHEYDHIEGVLFTDRLSPLKKRLLKGKLSDISKGKVAVDYRMRFPAKK